MLEVEKEEVVVFTSGILKVFQFSEGLFFSTHCSYRMASSRPAGFFCESMSCSRPLTSLVDGGILRWAR